MRPARRHPACGPRRPARQCGSRHRRCARRTRSPRSTGRGRGTGPRRTVPGRESCAGAPRGRPGTARRPGRWSRQRFPGKRSSTNVVSSAPATLPKVDSAKTPPAARAGVAPRRAGQREEHALREQPPDRGDAEHAVDRDLRHRGDRQAEGQQRARAAQPEGRPGRRGGQPDGEARTGIRATREPPAPPVAAGQRRQVDRQQHGGDGDGAAGPRHHPPQSEDFGREAGIAFRQQDRPDRNGRTAGSAGWSRSRLALASAPARSRAPDQGGGRPRSAWFASLNATPRPRRPQGGCSCAAREERAARRRPDVAVRPRRPLPARPPGEAIERRLGGGVLHGAPFLGVPPR